ncbi:MAG: hypothetical protein J6W81_04570 [Lentisphaeria bacterium]|nr:hypothetical protein [Lentisphaeria bacterium]
MKKIQWKISGGALIENVTAEMLIQDKTFSAETLRKLYDETIAGSQKFLHKEEKFNRIGGRSATSVIAALLALQDAGIREIDPEKTGILGIGRSGSHPENLRYWNDYDLNGRISGRGHYFVGTLASTPLCEVAITLGVRGPVLYLDPGKDAEALYQELYFYESDCDRVLLCAVNLTHTRCLLLEKGTEERFPEMLREITGGLE